MSIINGPRADHLMVIRTRDVILREMLDHYPGTRGLKRNAHPNLWGFSTNIMITLTITNDNGPVTAIKRHMFAIA